MKNHNKNELTILKEQEVKIGIKQTAQDRNERGLYIAKDRERPKEDKKIKKLIIKSFLFVQIVFKEVHEEKITFIPCLS